MLKIPSRHCGDEMWGSQLWLERWRHMRESVKGIYHLSLVLQSLRAASRTFWTGWLWWEGAREQRQELPPYCRTVELWPWRRVWRPSWGSPWVPWRIQRHQHGLHLELHPVGPRLLLLHPEEQFLIKNLIWVNLQAHSPSYPLCQGHKPQNQRAPWRSDGTVSLGVQKSCCHILAHSGPASAYASYCWKSHLTGLSLALSF